MGAQILHQLTLHRTLDFLVFFSSAAAIWGSQGLSHYAAANHYLDALACYRRINKQPALSINWARWGTASTIWRPISQNWLGNHGRRSGA